MQKKFFPDKRVSRNFFMACRIFFLLTVYARFFPWDLSGKNFFHVFGAAGTFSPLKILMDRPLGAKLAAKEA